MRDYIAFVFIDDILIKGDDQEGGIEHSKLLLCDERLGAIGKLLRTRN